MTNRIGFQSLMFAGLLLLAAGCKGKSAKKEKKPAQAEKTATKDKKTPDTDKPPPGPKLPKRRTWSDQMAGDPHWLDPREKEAGALNINGLKALGRKKYADAVQFIGQAVAKRPANTQFKWNLACARALNKDPEGAFKQLKMVLLRNFARFAPRALKRDKDLRSLRKGPHKERLKTMVAEARKKWAAELKHGVFFMGRTRKQRTRSLGTDEEGRDKGYRWYGYQEIFNFDAHTGRILQVTDEKGQVVGYLLSPDRRYLLYATATLKDNASAESGDIHTFRDCITDLKLKLLDLNRGKVIWKWLTPKTKLDPDDNEPPEPDTVCIFNGCFPSADALRFKTNHTSETTLSQTMPGEKEDIRSWAYTIKDGKVTRVKKPPAAACGGLSLRIDASGYISSTTGVDQTRVYYGFKRTAVKAAGVLPIDAGNKARLPCGGQVQRGQDPSFISFEPAASCKLKGKPMEGWWVQYVPSGRWIRISEHKPPGKYLLLREGVIMVRKGSKLSFTTAHDPKAWRTLNIHKAFLFAVHSF